MLLSGFCVDMNIREYYVDQDSESAGVLINILPVLTYSVCALFSCNEWIKRCEKTLCARVNIDFRILCRHRISRFLCRHGISRFCVDVGSLDFLSMQNSRIFAVLILNFHGYQDRKIRVPKGVCDCKAWHSYSLTSYPWGPLVFPVDFRGDIRQLISCYRLRSSPLS